MTEKELRKLRRQDLLQLLVLQSKETSDLQTRLEGLTDSYNRLIGKLDDKDETIERLKAKLDAKDEEIRALQVEAMEHAAAADSAGAMDPEALMETIRAAIIDYADRHGAAGRKDTAGKDE